ncbi:hypothetical protein ACGFWI_01245 [Streptomyces sp. NPDC048434]|uniref:hypothetical protein n=1 Tax=Streptomyces sp. NPDC048434 TaxID=3365549 RepID=UPI00371FF358
MAQVVKLEPGDVLVFSNVGDEVLSDGHTLDSLSEALRSVGIDQAIVFAGEVDLSKVRGDAVAGG